MCNIFGNVFSIEREGRVVFETPTHITAFPTTWTKTVEYRKTLGPGEYIRLRDGAIQWKATISPKTTLHCSTLNPDVSKCLFVVERFAVEQKPVDLLSAIGLGMSRTIKDMIDKPSPVAIFEENTGRMELTYGGAVNGVRKCTAYDMKDFTKVVCENEAGHAELRAAPPYNIYVPEFVGRVPLKVNTNAFTNLPCLPIYGDEVMVFVKQLAGITDIIVPKVFVSCKIDGERYNILFKETHYEAFAHGSSAFYVVEWLPSIKKTAERLAAYGDCVFIGERLVLNDNKVAIVIIDVKINASFVCRKRIMDHVDKEFGRALSDMGLFFQVFVPIKTDVADIQDVNVELRRVVETSRTIWLKRIGATPRCDGLVLSREDSVAQYKLKQQHTVDVLCNSARCAVSAEDVEFCEIVATEDDDVGHVLECMFDTHRLTLHRLRVRPDKQKPNSLSIIAQCLRATLVRSDVEVPIL